MSINYSKQIILINNCILGLLNLPQCWLPTLPGTSSRHQPVIEALPPVNASASTTVGMLGDSFITSFCTGHIVAPNNVPACGCMLFHRPRAPPRSLFRSLGSKFPPVIFIVWAQNIQTSVCIVSVALPELGSPDLGVDILNRKQSPKR